MFDAIVAGNVGADPEIKEVNGDDVLTFSVAHNYSRDKDNTTWFKVSVWGKFGTSLHKHLKKGDHVVVVGQCRVTEGKERTFLDIRASDVQMMGGSKPEHNGSKPELKEERKPRRGSGDDIPF